MLFDKQGHAVASRPAPIQTLASEAAGRFFRIDTVSARDTAEAFVRQLIDGIGTTATRRRASLEWNNVTAALTSVAHSNMRRDTEGITLKTFLADMAARSAADGDIVESAVRGVVQMMALGHSSPALRAQATAHSLACCALRQFATGSALLRTLEQLEHGTLQGCFALTESGGGSSINAIRSFASSDSTETLSVTGDKRWITGGQTADVGLVFADSELGPLALLVDTRELCVRRQVESAVPELSGYGLVRWTLQGAIVPRDLVVGEPGLATTHIVPDSLALGRLFVAAGALGVVLGCLSEALTYSRTRRAEGGRLLELQLIRRHITRLHCLLETSFLLCMKAATLRDERSPDFHLYAMEAKYCCAEAAVQATEASIQVCGAASFGTDSPLMAYATEAAVCGVIEGSSSVCEQTIPSYLELFA